MGSPALTRAPAGLADLSRDLDDLAGLIERREAVCKALTHEVHHRVKNNLQIITSLLNMQSNRATHPEAREALGQTRARIGALALIHRILYEEDDDGSIAALDVGRLVADLCAQFRLWNRERGEVTMSCQADPLPILLDSALPLALFAVEALTNAYAYAFPDGRSGTIRMTFCLLPDGQASLRVVDDGAGFDSSTPGYSMGRELMQGFAQQLGGTFTIVSSPATGTEARLDYPQLARTGLDLNGAGPAGHDLAPGRPSCVA
ncbi:sensor histidine kinase [Novosphingobium sp.]|uniref:sensor histidine kinase n=1 Tax=Novosphingobium sp. TaxID=1874826 RepID=UPI0027372EA1|nr:sensor histidine kinase [Novosphingobium sp.]MDP3906531.1 sensor histidine kinase [Novosphingobium sp.]